MITVNSKCTQLLSLENDLLKVVVAPDIGGRFISIYNKALNNEFLWHNPRLNLKRMSPGADYDSNFWGGIDELIPNDIPEKINGINYPDHGELWTASLDCTFDSDRITLTTILPLSKLFYKKVIRLYPRQPKIKLEYLIKNLSARDRFFLWKLHAALQIHPGDRLETGARKVRVVDPKFSRFVGKDEMQWPVIDRFDASIIPPQNGTMDFFYLYDIPDGKMSMVSGGGKYYFSYFYDKKVFPYQWYFASYGQFHNHYVAILEPATAMPVSVNEAATLGQSSFLRPGEEIHTSVTIYAGEKL